MISYSDFYLLWFMDEVRLVCCVCCVCRLLVIDDDGVTLSVDEYNASLESIGFLRRHLDWGAVFFLLPQRCFRYRLIFERYFSVGEFF